MPVELYAGNREATISKQRSLQPASQNPATSTPQPEVTTVIQRARRSPSSLKPNDVLQLQRTIGNQAVRGLLRSDAAGRSPRRLAPGAGVQRVVEVRPPGRGEASAFER